MQIEQDVALCMSRFPGLICRPIAAQFMAGDLIALFEFEDTPEGIRKSTEKHYRLVPQAELSTADLELYRTRSD